MKRDWVIAVVGAETPPFAASKAIAEEHAKQTLVQRILGEDEDPDPSPKDAAPRPVSAEEEKELAKSEEAAKSEKPVKLPPV